MARNHLSTHPSNTIYAEENELVSGTRERLIMYHRSSNFTVPWTSNYLVSQFIQRFKHISSENDFVPKIWRSG